MHICITATKISQSNFSPCNEPRYHLFSLFFNFKKIWSTLTKLVLTPMKGRRPTVQKTFLLLTVSQTPSIHLLQDFAVSMCQLYLHLLNGLL